MFRQYQINFVHATHGINHDSPFSTIAAVEQNSGKYKPRLSIRIASGSTSKSIAGESPSP